MNLAFFCREFIEASIWFFFFLLLLSLAQKITKISRFKVEESTYLHYEKKNFIRILRNVKFTLPPPFFFSFFPFQLRF